MARPILARLMAEPYTGPSYQGSRCATKVTLSRMADSSERHTRPDPGDRAIAATGVGPKSMTITRLPGARQGDHTYPSNSAASSRVLQGK